LNRWKNHSTADSEQSVLDHDLSGPWNDLPESRREDVMKKLELPHNVGDGRKALLL
jgi:hypothetical protein